MILGDLWGCLLYFIYLFGFVTTCGQRNTDPSSHNISSNISICVCIDLMLVSPTVTLLYPLVFFPPTPDANTPLC